MKPIINLLEVKRVIRDKIKSGVPTVIIVGGGAGGHRARRNVWKLVADNSGKAENHLDRREKGPSTMRPKKPVLWR